MAAKHLDLSLLEEGRARLLRYVRCGDLGVGGQEQAAAAAKAATLFAALEKLHGAYSVLPKNDYRTLANLG
jgi:hypothetical protein